MTNLENQRFGHWSVIEPSHKDRHGSYWLVRCDCGTEKAILATDLMRGMSLSCGCQRRQTLKRMFTTHGHAHPQTREYRSWSAMIQRCTNQKHHAYPDYGGRGVTVADRWNSFDNFLADMGSRPEGKMLDRIDNDSNYEPGNCRWATRLESNRNKRKKYNQ